MRSFRNHAVLLAVIVFISAIAIPTSLLAQVAGTAAISGRITDATGAAVPNATVTIRNTATSAAQTVTTDEQGRYTVPDLPIGPYEITAAKTGFQNAVRSGITLTVGSAPVVDFQLAVGQATQTVNVSAAAEQVQTTTAAVSSLVNQTQMRELPLNGRDFEQLILLAPGVSTYPEGGSSALTSVANAYSISGTRPEELVHRTCNIVYLLPFHGNRWKEGWQLTGIQAWDTGVPFTVTEGDQADLQNNFDTERPTILTGCNLYANQSVNNWFNESCFVPSPYGTIGNLGRNTMVGPGYVDTDFGVLKSTRINERFNLQFRAELFNIFNHANFSVPSGAVFTAGVTPTLNPAGSAITTIVGNARQTQFSLKLIF